MRRNRRKPQEINLTRSHLLALKLFMELMGRIKDVTDYDSITWQNAKVTTTPVSARWNSRRIDIDLVLASGQTISLETFISFPSEGNVQISFKIWVDEGDRLAWNGGGVETANGELVISEFRWFEVRRAGA